MHLSVCHRFPVTVCVCCYELLWPRPCICISQHSSVSCVLAGTGDFPRVWTHRLKHKYHRDTCKPTCNHAPSFFVFVLPLADFVFVHSRWADINSLLDNKPTHCLSLRHLFLCSSQYPLYSLPLFRNVIPLVLEKFVSFHFSDLSSKIKNIH